MNLQRHAQDFVYLVILVWWIKCASFCWDVEPGLDLVEYFAGVGRIAKTAYALGYESRAYEIDYDVPPHGESSHSNMPKRSSFDLNGEAGFVSLG